MSDKKDKKAIEERFTQIYNAYRSSIYKFCLARLKGDSHRAEDCMQNTFMVFYRKLRNDEEIENPRAFLYRTAQNYVMKCYDKITKENNKIVPISDYEDRLEDKSISMLDSELDYELLTNRLKAVLTFEEQQLLELKYINDMTIEQVAKTLGISKPATAKRLQRLREKLKINFEGKENGYAD